jgi:hypothetical protein
MCVRGLCAGGGCLGSGAEEGRGKLRKARGRCTRPLIPGSPNGNPAWFIQALQLYAGAGTGGSEASQYPQEKKSTEMPGVAASETGRGQTEPPSEELGGMWSCRTRALPSPSSRSGLECPAVEGESPVGERGEGRFRVS